MTSRAIVGLIVSGFASTILIACSGQSPLAPNGSPAAGASSSAAGAAGAVGAIPVHLGDAGPEYVDVMNQGGVGVYAEDAAMLVRQPNGVRLSVTLPTPQPGGYVYAPGFTVVGPPEVFTLWAFIFNFPENCTAPCDSDDIGLTKPAKGGAYNVGGHVGSGSSFTIAGRIGVGEAPFNPAVHAVLEAPATAEIHLALAPHGALDPARLPDDFRRPTGSPLCGCWWVAFFK